MALSSIGVVGGGSVGAGLAAGAAVAGLRVQLVDATQAALEGALRNVMQLYAVSLSEGRLTEDALRDALGLISASTDLNDLAQAELVVETIVDDFAAKAALLKELDRVCRSDAVLITDSHCSSVTRLAAQTGRPSMVIGMHLLPASGTAGAIEIVRGLDSAPAAISRVAGLASALGMDAVEVNDLPGCVSDRLLLPAINEAVSALMEGVASREAIDGAARAAFGLNQGLLEMADEIGLDLCLDRLRAMHEGTGNGAYRPCLLLVRMVEAGRLGRKSGRGFYEYGDHTS